MILINRPKNGFFSAVVCFCFSPDERILLLQKRKDSKHYPGLWGIPGGKVNPKEEIAKAVTREIKEETGNSVDEEMVSLISKTYHRHKIEKGYYIYFNCHTFLSKVTLETIVLDENEHMNYMFVKPQSFLKFNNKLLIPDTLDLYNKLA